MNPEAPNSESPQRRATGALRIDYLSAFPDGYTTLADWGHAINTSGLEQSLLELISMRSSTLNGCAMCLDKHSKQAIKAGETTERLFAIAAWRDAPYFTPRERAALQWTDAITNIQVGHAPEAAWNEMLIHFTEAEAVQITHAIANMNAWNRLAIAFRHRIGEK
jgi:AhpD family alkylhydroperoxidase